MTPTWVIAVAFLICMGVKQASLFAWCKSVDLSRCMASLDGAGGMMISRIFFRMKLNWILRLSCALQKHWAISITFVAPAFSPKTSPTAAARKQEKYKLDGKFNDNKEVIGWLMHHIIYYTFHASSKVEWKKCRWKWTARTVSRTKKMGRREAFKGLARFESKWGNLCAVT